MNGYPEKFLIDRQIDRHRRTDRQRDNNFRQTDRQRPFICGDPTRITVRRMDIFSFFLF